MIVVVAHARHDQRAFRPNHVEQGVDETAGTLFDGPDPGKRRMDKKDGATPNSKAVQLLDDVGPRDMHDCRIRYDRTYA